MRIALTGGTGFLGSVLARQLVASGHEVRALTRTLPRQDAEPDPRVRRIQGDLASPRDAAALVEDAEAVIHLAWTNTPLTSNAHLPSDASANLLPTLTLIEAMRATGSRAHVVFASSGGAVNALALVERHPEQVRTLVAHEPPLLHVLPDREAALVADRQRRRAPQIAGVIVPNVECLPRTISNRIVGPGSELVFAAVDGPC